jgi:hypothetical protein
VRGLPGCCDQADAECYLSSNFSEVKALDRHLKSVAKALDKGYNHEVLEKVRTLFEARGLLLLSLSLRSTRTTVSHQSHRRAPASCPRLASPLRSPPVVQGCQLYPMVTLPRLGLSFNF